MSMNVDDEVLMGMGIDSCSASSDGFEIRTPGAKVWLGTGDDLVVEQRIVAEREVFRSNLPRHLSPWALRQTTPFRRILSGNGMDLTVQGDSVLILSPQQNLRLAFQGRFEPKYRGEQGGSRLLLDEEGGCGFFSIPERASTMQRDSEKYFHWSLGFHLARWEELWICVWPPRKRSPERYCQSIAHEGTADDPYPSDELIEDASRHCQILAVHES